MTKPQDHSGYLEGQLLIATPMLVGSCFEKSVIYICAHTPDGAMGLIINHLVEAIDVRDIFRQLEITVPNRDVAMPVHFGGPMDSARGFVLHSSEYARKETVLMDTDIALTCNIDILKDIASGQGPARSILALGYAGWGAGQLEQELETNSWLTAPASMTIVFNTPNASKWLLAAQLQGIDLHKLSGDVGHA
jgi:putative transcriptional regulator